MKYFVFYNAQCMGIFKSVKSCINLINRKGWKNDDENLLWVTDQMGNPYDPTTGQPED